MATFWCLALWWEKDNVLSIKTYIGLWAFIQKVLGLKFSLGEMPKGLSKINTYLGSLDVAVLLCTNNPLYLLNILLHLIYSNLLAQRYEKRQVNLRQGDKIRSVHIIHDSRECPF